MSREAPTGRKRRDEGVAYRWVWRGTGLRAHLIPEHRTGSANPWALCGQRVRRPGLHWNGLCPNCLRGAQQLDEQWEQDPPLETR